MKNKNIYNMYIGKEDIISFPLLAKSDLENTIDNIKKVKTADKTFLNTILAYETSTYHWAKIMGKISNYALCHTDKEMRDLANKSEVEYFNILNKLFYDKDLYDSVMNYINGNFIEEKDFLDNEDLKLVEDLILGFSKSGFHLDKKDLNKVIALDKKINTLSNKFDQNLVKDTPFILCDTKDLEGIPENIINSFEKVGLKYKVTIQYPEYGPFMRYATSREKRRELYKLFMNNGGKENIKILDDLIALRKDKSKIIGFETHAHYRLVDRLAKKPDNVYNLLNNLVSKLEKKSKKDILVLEKEAKKYNIAKLENYDMTFVVNKILERDFKYDEQKLREFLELDTQIEKMFSLFEKIFNIKIKSISEQEKKTLKLWHKDVKVFEVLENNKKQNRISLLLMDLFPRDGKFGHACMHTIYSAHNIDSFEALEGKQLEKNIPASLIICNFSKPNKTVPSLINFEELETLYHEAGHAMHSLLSKAKYSTHFGANVSWDFVELPSQIMELWLSDKKYLKSVTKHYITGKKIDDVFIDNLLSAKNLFKSLFYMRQIIYGIFDLDINIKDVVNKRDYLQDLFAKYYIKDEEDIIFLSRFAHLARGYDAGYYSYIWAEIIVHDVFSEFIKSGIENKTIGLKYRKEILERGSSRDEEESIKEFLGRKYDIKAFLEYLK